MNKSVKSRINASLQGIVFFYELRVKDILRMYHVLYGSAKKLDLVIEEFGFTGILKEKYRNLSGGQKQRHSLAIAFINDAELLFLDEPTEGLDPISRNHIWEIIKREHKKGKTILLTSHYMEEVEELCDRVVFIKKGKIVINDNLEGILRWFSGVSGGAEKVITDRLFRKGRSKLEDVYIKLMSD